MALLATMVGLASALNSGQKKEEQAKQAATNAALQGALVGLAGANTAQTTQPTTTSKSSSKSSTSSSKTPVGPAPDGASDYWNTRGDTAKMYQAWLNTQGAGLQVDGIWGKKTEAAYQQNKDAFEEWLNGGNDKTTTTVPSGDGYYGSTGSGGTTIAGINSNDLSGLMSQYQDPSYTAKSEAELRAEAEALYNPVYNANVLAANQRNEEYQLAVQQQIEALERALSKSQSETQKSYDLAGQELQRMLTARGMGRSTYAGDVAQNNQIRANKALTELLNEHTAQTGQLAQQGAQYRKQTADTLAQLLKDKEQNITNYLYQLQGREYDRTASSQDRYNALVGNLQGMLNSYSLSQQQMALEKELAQMQMAAALAGIA